MSDAVQFLGELTAGRDLVANVDYTDPSGFLWITLWDAKVGEPRVEESINAEVLAEGLAMVPRKLRPWERAFSTELDKVRELERVAREEERRGMWEYGDLTED
jgi:staphylococcal nuclease domain-containing protein 1